MSSPFLASQTFAPAERSASEARNFVRRTLAEWSVDDVTDLAVLAVSELVTNAVVHAGTDVVVRLSISDDHLRLEVTDARPDRGLPLQPVLPGDEGEGGRGLVISSTLTSHWGVEYTPTSKSVWLSWPVQTPTPVSSEALAPDAPPESDKLAPAPPSTNGGGPPATSAGGPLGLREAALNRLGLDEYLQLAVERAREALAADAAYLLIGHELDPDFEVRALSGLDDSLRGTRWKPETPGTPNARNPHLPIVVADLDVHGVPLLEGTGLRSLVVVPVTVDGRVTGALGAASYRAQDFSADQAGMLQRIADQMAGAAERARLRTAERQRRGWLSFVAAAGDLLAGTLDQRMTMAITGQILVPDLAQWCAVYLHDERGHPVLQQVWHQDETFNDDLVKALDDVPLEEVGELDQPLLRCELHRLPLVARGQEIGAVLLGRETGSPLEGEVLLVAESIVRRAALAIDNARAHGELQAIGQALQDSLLPRALPSAPDLDVGVVYEAAGQASTVGGDFYDLFAIGGGRWCFVVGDVCGTGAEAAAVTGLARHTIRALATAGFPVGDILERLNTAILDEGERSRFLTLVCGVLAPAAGGRVLLTLVCAGHPPPFLVGNDGQVRQVGRPQSLLGVLEDTKFAAEEHVLKRGELLVAVTDGVLERRDGDRMLGDEGLSEELAREGNLQAQAVAERVRRLVLDFADTPQTDDMAVLAVRLGQPG